MSVPFIGSRISLISKSDVRYEGKLCGIDTNESKVYLQHVRCFGTEDRRKENPIAPSPEIYEVIIFHSSDIKDLSVCELAPYDPMGYNSYSPMAGGYPQYGYPMMNPQYGPQYGYPYPYNNYGVYSQMMPPQDVNSPFGSPLHHPPSIPTVDNSAESLQFQQPQKINVTATKVDQPTEQTPSPQPTNANVENNKESEVTPDAKVNSAPPSNKNTPPSDEQKGQKQSGNAKNNFNQNKKSNYKNNNAKTYQKKNNNAAQPANDENNRANQNAEQSSPAPSAPTPSPQPEKVENSPADNSPVSQSAKINNNNTNEDSHNNQVKRNDGGHHNNNDHRQRGNNKRGYNKHYNNNNNRRGGFDSRNHSGNHSHNNYSSQPQPPQHHQKPKANTEKVDKVDFDFDSANSKFQKLSLTPEIEKELPKISQSYNKDSFYDNISCDTLDRLENNNNDDKKSFYEQRKLDSETFGDLARRNNNRGHTRGRYESHSQNNQKRYNNGNNNRNNNYRNFRGNKTGSNYQNKEKNNSVAQE